MMTPPCTCNVFMHVMAAAAVMCAAHGLPTASTTRAFAAAPPRNWQTISCSVRRAVPRLLFHCDKIGKTVNPKVAMGAAGG